MLRFYSERLNAVEINNSFYHMPKEGVLASWAEQVPAEFVFALKAPQIITHLKRLRNVGEETAYLFRSLSVLDRKLGPVLFQFPNSFRADHPAKWEKAFVFFKHEEEAKGPKMAIRFHELTDSSAKKLQNRKNN